MIGANLSDTNLSGAILENVDLRRANFNSCNLTDVQLEGAKLQLALYNSETILSRRSAKELGTWNSYTKSNTTNSVKYDQ